jgi:hypothetical protein
MVHFTQSFVEYFIRTYQRPDVQWERSHGALRNIQKYVRNMEMSLHNI